MSTNMTLIETKTAGSGGVSSFDFTSIPQTYTDLMLVISIRYSTGGQIGTATWIQFNGLTTNQTSRMLNGNGASASSYTDTKIFAQSNGSSSTASTFGNSQFYIPNYTSSNFKSVSIDGVSENNATTAYAELAAGLWSSTAAITSITLKEYNGSYTIAEGSTASLYGISNVTSTTKATGGIVSSDGTYNYHMFPFSGTFTPTQNITADYLVIAGGGGGGRENFDSGIGGGGGAGGLRSTVGSTGGGGSLESALSLTANTGYTVTIGAGGAARTTGGVGNNGSDSVFSTITSTGGGGGGGGVTGTGNNYPGQAGGSGGGGQGDTQGINGGTRTASPVQGFNGGAANNGGEPGGGAAGGGGAGEAGNTDGFGEGGDGVAISAFANATQTGVNTYYAGGGGGANYTFKASGGLGGGGTGGVAATSNGVNGTTNTGSGGGGGGNDAGFTSSGAGGSGLVIIRYAI